MTDTAQRSSGPAPANETSYNSIAGSTFPVGTPVCPSADDDGVVVPAKGISSATNATGIAATPGVEGQPVRVQFAGVIDLTRAQWDLITEGNDQLGLVRGAPYFLKAGFGSGKLTLTAPSSGGTFVAPMGVGLSPTELLIRADPPSEN